MEKPKAKFLSPEEQLESVRRRTYEERFFLLLRMIKLQKMLASATPSKTVR